MIWWILILAFLLRLVTLDQSLWLDEAINVLAAKNLSWFDFVARYPIGDFHPPGYFALLWPFTRIFGFSEIAVRMPSLLLGVGTVYLTYLLGKKLFDKKIAGLAALFLAVGPLHVFYSQEARMYSLAAFSVALSSYFLVKWVKGEPWARWAYLISAVLVFYSDYVAYLIFPAHLLYILFIERKIMKEFILSWVSAFIFFLP
ncbi:MAG: Glycosyl transferase family 39, partial [Candidatus Daviesbacteria bacterium GW2011_GWA2_42_7]